MKTIPRSARTRIRAIRASVVSATILGPDKIRRRLDDPICAWNAFECVPGARLYKKAPDVYEIVAHRSLSYRLHTA